MNNKIYLPGLNGLRALAALSVVLSHVFMGIYGSWGLEAPKLPLFTDGVTLFFVISGFLITYLLLQELDKTGTIDVSKFYVRRILRIWPIYYLFILVVIAVLYLNGHADEILNTTLYYYLFFAANIPFVSAAGIGLIVHYWSIGVEEQFYLLWPWLLKLKKKNLVSGALAVLCLWMMLKVGSYFLFTNKSVAYKFFNVTRFHCMMIGALGAMGFYYNHALFLKIVTNKWSQLAAWSIFIFSGMLFQFIPAVITPECIAVLSLCLIMGQVAGNPGVINLENKYFDFIGKISYGIYVIHPLVIYLSSWCWRQAGFRIPPLLSYLVIYLYVIGVTLLLAWFLYKNFEKPFLKLKNKFAIIHSSNSMNVR